MTPSAHAGWVSSTLLYSIFICSALPTRSSRPSPKQERGTCTLFPGRVWPLSSLGGTVQEPGSSTEAKGQEAEGKAGAEEAEAEADGTEEVEEAAARGRIRPREEAEDRRESIGRRASNFCAATTTLRSSYELTR